MLRYLMIAALATGGVEAATPAITPDLHLDGWAAAGPSWLSIESPPNPYNPETKGALLVVRVYHHNEVAFYPVTGTAEGLVNGKRQSVTLSFTQTSTPGMYALKFERPSPGAWVLMIHVGDNPEHNEGTAMVTLDAQGLVANVSVPTRTDGRYVWPRQIGADEVNAKLKAMVGG